MMVLLDSELRSVRVRDGCDEPTSGDVSRKTSTKIQKNTRLARESGARTNGIVSAKFWTFQWRDTGILFIYIRTVRAR